LLLYNQSIQILLLHVDNVFDFETLTACNDAFSTGMMPITKHRHHITNFVYLTIGL